MFSARRFRERFARSVSKSIATDYQLREERRINFDRVEQILFKVTEYDIFLNAAIERQFNEVTFIGLVRDGYGLCDSWKRRGMSAWMAGKVYSYIGGQMIAERNSRSNYILLDLRIWFPILSAF
jgi:hypothetical protein